MELSGLAILIIAVCAAIFLVLAAIAPKVLVLLTWPILLCYPHRLTFGLLPMNAGIDDLYIIMVFLIILPRFGPGRFSYPILAVIGLMLVFLFANLTGWLTLNNPELAQTTIKVFLKTCIFLFFTWTAVMCIQTEKDMKYHAISFLASMGMASGLALADYFQIPWSEWFWVPVIAGMEDHGRATGAFNTPDSLGSAILLPIFLCVSFASLPRKPLLRMFSIVVCVLCGGALLLSRSRSGWLGLAFGVLFMLFTARRKHVVIMYAAIVGVLFVVFFGAFWAEQMRITIENTWTGSGEFQSHGRFWIWGAAIENPYFAMLFFGRGSAATGRIMFFSFCHSMYLDFIYLFGVGGTVYFVHLFVRSFRASGWLRKNDPDPFLRMCSQGIWLGLIASCGVGITAEVITYMFWQFGTFFWLVWMWQRQYMLGSQGYMVPYYPKRLRNLAYYDDQEYSEPLYDDYQYEYPYEKTGA